MIKAFTESVRLNMGLNEMAGEVVNQTVVLSIKCCAWRQVSASKPPLR